MNEQEQLLANDELRKKQELIIGYIATGSYEDEDEHIRVNPTIAGKDLRDWDYIQGYYFPNNKAQMYGSVKGMFEPFPVALGHTADEARQNLVQHFKEIKDKQFGVMYEEALWINEIYDKLWLIYNVGNSIRGSTRQEYVKRIFELLGELGL